MAQQKVFTFGGLQGTAQGFWFGIEPKTPCSRKRKACEMEFETSEAKKPRCSRDKTPKLSRKERRLMSAMERVAKPGDGTDFKQKYQEHDKLGSGGFGSVFAGVRIADMLPVAIKHIRRKSVDFVSQIIGDELYTIPYEVLLMTKAAPDAEIGLNPSVSLLEWFSVKDEIILMLAFQLVGAMADLHSKGVFHRDLKLQNLLIECTWLGPRVRIIDFGCGAVSRPGTFSYFSEHIYSAVPTTVWQIGAVLYELLRQNEQRPFSTQGYLANRLHIPHGLSKKCSDFLQACLTEIPEDRITLDQLKDHPWLRT
ncbi:hypothetical protein WMY93_007798 [Mugilogobius chulae]|uniref:non-specific serine/threonine protein kinase n=1 Tax=Mugilogobius chulae TaxID=88201 RepID=A0AAW0PE46_9GOBI